LSRRFTAPTTQLGFGVVALPIPGACFGILVAEESQLDIESILRELREERDRIDSAISALEGSSGRGGRRPGPKATDGRRGRRRLSVAAKKRISEAAKARWAKVKKVGGNRL